jgi:hypothetical protein
MLRIQNKQKNSSRKKVVEIDYNENNLILINYCFTFVLGKKIEL